MNTKQTDWEERRKKSEYFAGEDWKRKKWRLRPFFLSYRLILELMTDTDRWEGTPTELMVSIQKVPRFTELAYKYLKERRCLPPESSWQMGYALKRIDPMLRSMGINITRFWRGGKRVVVLIKTEQGKPIPDSVEIDV